MAAYTLNEYFGVCLSVGGRDTARWLVSSGIGRKHHTTKMRKSPRSLRTVLWSLEDNLLFATITLNLPTEDNRNDGASGT